MRRPNAHLRSAEPRIFGVVPPLFALGLGIALLIGGAAIAIGGSLLPGLVVLLAGALLLGFAIEAARRWPTSAIARVFVWLIDTGASRLGFARAFAGTWLGAARRVAGLRRDLRRLRGERSAAVLTLGEAAYAGGEAEVGELRARIEEIDRRIEAAEAECEEAVEGARERVERHRSAAQPTEAIAVEEVVAAAGKAKRGQPTEETRQRPTEVVARR